MIYSLSRFSWGVNVWFFFYSPSPLCDYFFVIFLQYLSKSGSFFFLHWVKCSHCIMQNNSTESSELWTQFCRHPNLKDRETTTWFFGTCSACCGDCFGGRGHCVEIIVSEKKKKKKLWAELIPLYAFRVSGRNGCSACQVPVTRIGGSQRISADYISWSGKKCK